MKTDDTGSRTFDKTGCWQPPTPTHPQKLRGVPSKSTDDGTHVNPHVTRRSVTRRKTTVTAREPTVKCLNRRAPNRRTLNSQSLYMIPAPVPLATSLQFMPCSQRPFLDGITRIDWEPFFHLASEHYMTAKANVFSINKATSSFSRSVLQSAAETWRCSQELQATLDWGATETRGSTGQNQRGGWEQPSLRTS